MLRTIAILALATAVYGAALALAQRSTRRACGYLFVSQSALVMAGLDCTSATALAGGLLVWLSAGLAFAGLARCVLVLEARRGRLDLTTYHGGYERMPLLAISFLAMGLACTGFPGTLGFVGQELLVAGAIDQFPVMGFAIVIASALTGLAVVRMYFSLFCGRSDPPTRASMSLALRRREAWTFGALVVTMIVLGIAPRPLADSRVSAAEEILRQRQRSATQRPGDDTLLEPRTRTIGDSAPDRSERNCLVIDQSVSIGRALAGDRKHLLRRVIHLQGCVFDPKALAQQPFELAAHRVAVRRRGYEHMRGQDRDAWRQLPQVQIVHLPHKLGARHGPANLLGRGALRRTFQQHANRLALKHVSRSEHQASDDERRDCVGAIEAGHDDDDAGDERTDKGV
jgi:hypothetical protein